MEQVEACGGTQLAWRGQEGRRARGQEVPRSTQRVKTAPSWSSPAAMQEALGMSRARTKRGLRPQMSIEGMSRREEESSIREIAMKLERKCSNRSRTKKTDLV